MNMKILFLAALSCYAYYIAASPVDLVENGMPVSEIVIGQNANQSIKLASADLQYYLKQISGAELKIVDNPTSGVKTHVYIGESDSTKKLGFIPSKFISSGYEIVSGNDYLILYGPDRISPPNPFSMARDKNALQKWRDFTGENFSISCIGAHLGHYVDSLQLHSNDDTGSWYAVSDLLEQLGVRFYAPYEDGTVIPKLGNIVIPEQRKKVEAPFKMREWSAGREAEGLSWLKRLKCGNYAAVNFNHLTYAIFTSPEQKELHPEYYAYESEGKPYPGFPDGSGMPRFSDPGFRKASVLLGRKMFDAFPELSAVAMGQPDGGIRLDYRDQDKYGDGDMWQKISNYFWEYSVFVAQELKKTHPDKKLIYMCYGRGVELVPTIIGEVPENLIVAPMFFVSSDLAMDSSYSKPFDKARRWVEAVKPSGVGPAWDYFNFYMKPSNPRYPVFFTETLQREMIDIQPLCFGKFVEVVSDATSKGLKGLKRGYEGADRISEYPITCLMMYWQSKLYWDPSLDRQAFLDEYYRLFFGPAAAEMKEFHEFAEAVWCRQESRSVTQTTGFLKPADVDKYFEILSRARGKAGKDSIYDRRIAAMEKAYGPLKTLFPNLTRKGPEMRAYPVPDNFEIDGDMGKYRSFNTLSSKHSGKTPDANKTNVRVSMSENGNKLFIAAICNEDKMDQIKAKTMLNDKFEIFYDDVLEVYINTPERNYFKIAVNPNGAVYDESTDTTIVNRDTLPVLWNPGIKAVVKKYDDRWTVELMIPTNDLGSISPTRQYPWGIQIGRTRFADGTGELSAFGTGPGGYAIQTQWGNLWAK